MPKYSKTVFFIIPASIIFAVLWGGELPYFVMYAVVLTVLFSFLWGRIVTGKLDFTQKALKEVAYVGDEITIRTMAYNESLLPVPFAEIKNNMVKDVTGKAPCSTIVSILPFSSSNITDKMKCKYRGFYALGPISLTVSDIFGLFTWTREIKCKGSLSVYPQIVQLERFDTKPMQMFGTITTKQKANEDYSSISDIKKYFPGASFKKIHWKVSARKGSLYIKNFEMNGSSESYIFFNLCRNDYNDIYRADLEEKAVECSVSIIRYMLSLNISVGMYANCSRMVYIKGRDLKEFKNFMEELIRVKSDGVVPIDEMIKARSKLLPHGSSIIIVTPGFSDSLVQEVVSLRETGFDVIIVYIMLEDLSQEDVRIINQCGIRLYRIGLGDDIKTSLEG